MRLWSIHPKYLDSKGIVALWREGLLAHNVLAGKTRGYTKHPQLHRFKSVAHIDMYLSAVYDESIARGYRFNKSKIVYYDYIPILLPISNKQLEYEAKHLRMKLEQRNQSLVALVGTTPHPMFYSVASNRIEPWEIL